VFTYDAFDVISLLLDGAGPVVALDVGANIGDLSVRLLHELPGASVFAFEPVPETFARLQSRAASSPRSCRRRRSRRSGPDPRPER
jgi:hypothetical protein